MYDYLRLLFARIGIPHDPETGEELVRQTPQQIVDKILTMEEGLRFQVLAPVVKGRKGTYDTLLADFAGQGFVRAIVDGQLIDLNESTNSSSSAMRRTTSPLSSTVSSCAKGSSAGSPTDRDGAQPHGGIAELQIVPKEGSPRRSSSANTCRPSDGKSFDELRRGISPSTRRTAPAHTAMVSAPCSRSMLAS